MATMALASSSTIRRPGIRKSAVLWTVQGILAAVFLFAGGFKLALPLDVLASFAPLPAMFLKFIGLCEVSGAFGLLLPGIFRIRTILTPIAAAGLVIIMIGAVTLTVATMDVPSAAMPFVVGLLAAYVAYARGVQPRQTGR